MEGLVLQSLTAGYGNKQVIKNLTLTVNNQETLVLMGLSGSGKSTLLKTILGIVAPQQGSMLLHGKDITALPIEQRNIGYVPQDYGLFPHLTVSANVSYGLRVRGSTHTEQQAKANDMLTFVGLPGYGLQHIHELSGGQQQRVALARALAIQPDLLLLDEPLSSIDQATKFDVATQLKSLFSSLKIPIIFVTHQHEDARFLGGRLAIMIDGIIEQIGPVSEVIQTPKTAFIKKLLTPFYNQ